MARRRGSSARQAGPAAPDGGAAASGEDRWAAVIVTDTNLLAYLLLGGTGTPAAQAVFLRDPVWTARLLWRSAFRSILAGYLRRRELRIDDAIEVQQKNRSAARGPRARCSVRAGAQAGGILNLLCLRWRVRAAGRPVERAAGDCR